MPSDTQADGAAPKALAMSSTIEEGLRNLDEQGYTVHRDFLAPEQLEQVRSRLLEQAECELRAGVATVSSSGHAGKGRHYGGAYGEAPPISPQVSFLPNKGAEFREIMHHPVALDYARHAFRDVPFNVVTQSGSFLRKGAQRQALHADQQAWPFATPLPVMLNVLIALSDFDEDMGATNVVPGSHRFPSPDIAHSPEEAAAAIGSVLLPMVCKAGDALIFEAVPGTASRPPTPTGPGSPWRRSMRCTW